MRHNRICLAFSYFYRRHLITSRNGNELFKTFGFYVGGAISGHCDHWHLDRDVVARGSTGPRGRQTNNVCEQPEANCVGDAQLRIRISTVSLRW